MVDIDRSALPAPLPAERPNSVCDFLQQNAPRAKHTSRLRNGAGNQKSVQFALGAFAGVKTLEPVRGYRQIFCLAIPTAWSE